MVEVASYGPWAVVTGASSGIGKAFADQLAAAGLNLVLAARSTGKLYALGQALAESHGVSYRVVTVDLSDPAGAMALLAATDDLDIGLLVSNAGSGHPVRCWTSHWTTCTAGSPSTPSRTWTWCTPSPADSSLVAAAASC